MNEKGLPRAIIAGVSSAIGFALAGHLLGKGWRVDGTSRSPQSVHGLGQIEFCDFLDAASIDRAASVLPSDWDLLVVAPGTLVPVAPFLDVSMSDWQDNLMVNLVGPLQFTQALLRKRQNDEVQGKCLFFAGGGVNSAPVGVSAYTISKIALIKAVEILDKEIDAVTFAILGPGWVETPIHAEVLESPLAPSEMVAETRRRIRDGDFVPTAKVLSAIDWIIDSPKSLVGGRNFSAAGDVFGTADLTEVLSQDPDAFKLRRHSNTASTRGIGA